ncbi:MAG TPA: TPM domain-containing protein [Verrucomicrobiae bacterium]
MKRLAVIVCWLWPFLLFGAEVIPPAPSQYFNDYAHVVPASVASQLNTKLEAFEKATSDQVLVVVYPQMQSDSSIDDYTIRVARAWKAGQKVKNNGVVLFVFIQNRQMFIQVGYGLEGVLPDATCKQITEYEIKPRFQAGDYTGGLTAGVNAILAATQNEYKGTGRTVAQGHSQFSSLIPIIIFLAIFILLASRRRGAGWIITGGGWGGWGGGGGFSSGGGGGFSGGGGSFGGGGAGSSW